MRDGIPGQDVLVGPGSLTCSGIPGQQREVQGAGGRERAGLTPPGAGSAVPGMR